LAYDSSLSRPTGSRRDLDGRWQGGRESNQLTQYPDQRRRLRRQFIDLQHVWQRTRRRAQLHEARLLSEDDWRRFAATYLERGLPCRDVVGPFLEPTPTAACRHIGSTEPSAQRPARDSAQGEGPISLQPARSADRVFVVAAVAQQPVGEYTDGDQEGRTVGAGRRGVAQSLAEVMDGSVEARAVFGGLSLAPFALATLHLAR
jgi:hypothetical protein